MTERSTVHATFTIDRTFDAAPARVFKAFADPTAKAKWFGRSSDKYTVLAHEFDFRVGGHERASGRWAGGPTSHFDCRYYDIVPNERIVFAYEMHLDDRKISVSLTSIEFRAAGKGTRFVFTEHGAFLDGWDNASGREEGTRGLIDTLEASLK